ncbi:MAG: hypothetical protein Q7R45_16980 [Sulfuricaulis sp.]|nr:hypothetical protein [Sulfuricaulis sp.]
MARPQQQTVMRAMRLQQLTELLNGKARVASDAAHSECVDRIVAGNGHDALTVGHDDVLSLTHDPETSLFQCAHGVEVIYAGDLGQS